MSTILTDLAPSRAALRDAYLRSLEEGFDERKQSVEGGSWDGVPVLTEPAFNELLSATLRGPIPPTNDQHAEIRTPGTVIVSAICPRCDLPTTVILTVSPELVVDDSGAEIRVKTKAKARAHVCGQQEIFDRAALEDDSQMRLEDLVGETEEALVVSRLEEIPGAWSLGEDDQTCEAEAEIEDPEGSSSIVDAICGLPIDHDERDHVAVVSGGKIGERPVVLAWHYETRPVPTGVSGAEPTGEPETPEDEPDEGGSPATSESDQ